MQNPIRSVVLKVVYTTDVHGCFLPVDFANPQLPCKGGLSCVHAYLCRLRREWEGRCVLLDGGDMLQGTPVTYYHNYLSGEREHLAARMMNRMGYDAACIGNHDLETGHGVYDRWIRDCRFPVLGANLTDEATGRPYLPPYAMVERAGVRMAVLGLVTAAVPYWLPRFLWSGIRIENMIESARRWMEHIRRTERPHVIIGVFHSGMEGGMAVPGAEENVTKALLEQVEGFDAVCCGHDHLRHLTAVTDAAGRRVPVVSPSACAWQVGELTLRLALDGDRVCDKEVEARLVDVTSCHDGEARAFEESFRDDLDRVAGFVNEKIAVSDAPVRSRDAYFGPSGFVDLQHAMQLDLTGADVSFASPVVYDTVLPEGDIRVRDMFNLYKFENFLCTLRLSGREIIGALEWSYGRWVRQMHAPDEHIMLLAPDSGGGGKAWFAHFAYNFDSAAGIRYTVDVTKPEGRRVEVECMADGQPFSPDKTYVVATNSYRATGGGEMFTGGCGLSLDGLSSRLITVSPRDIRHYFTDYLRRQGHFSAQPLGLWRFVPDGWAEGALKRDRQLLFDS
ncbi:MAG: 5'-nucleotidase C-terminal domain-containing protein [Paraprevotella sp.]|nr:5'-nucleotidase C-terminal domain-containing protein [Paraprevotella sp.]